MGLEALVILAIYLLIVVVIAAVLGYALDQAGAPPPAKLVLWVVTFLICLLIVLRRIGLVSLG